MAEPMTSTSDHVVPQMYLQRFAEQRGARYFSSVVPVSRPNEPFRSNIRKVGAVTGFYWWQRDGDDPSHLMEQVLNQIEGDAVPAFNHMLDDPDYALPKRWPLDDELRGALAWWMSAQMLRTARQRKRLAFLADSDQLSGDPLRASASADHHLGFMARLLGGMALLLYSRPWGLGFSDTCLLTSDVPLVVLNGHDHDDQALSLAFWDVLLPLDPHRLLFLPGSSKGLTDPRKTGDHRFKFDSGFGTVVNQIMFDAADRHLFQHPQHPAMRGVQEGARLPTPWDGPDHATGPSYIVEYPALAPEFTVERRWLTEHPPQQQGVPGPPNPSPS